MNPNTSDLAIEASALSKSYGKTRALERAAFALQPGQWAVLLGENGAGKSTLIQLLCGLFSPDEGSIRIAGIDLTNDPCAALGQLGVVFQQPTLDMDLSVQDNLLYHAGLHGLSRSDALQRISLGLEQAGLAPLQKSVVRSLSGGQRRRVELVRALLHRPRVVLMDEATVGLDPASRQQLVALVRQKVSTEGLCVLWTTHWAQEVTHADRLMILHKGRMAFDADPSTLLAQTGQTDLEQAFLQFSRQQG
jgi:ABC-2 type transport system ATP-binding protein